MSELKDYKSQLRDYKGHGVEYLITYKEFMTEWLNNGSYENNSYCKILSCHDFNKYGFLYDEGGVYGFDDCPVGFKSEGDCEQYREWLKWKKWVKGIDEDYRLNDKRDKISNCVNNRKYEADLSDYPWKFNYGTKEYYKYKHRIEKNIEKIRQEQKKAGIYHKDWFEVMRDNNKKYEMQKRVREGRIESEEDFKFWLKDLGMKILEMIGFVVLIFGVCYICKGLVRM
jgi:hypothetical protein